MPERLIRNGRVVADDFVTVPPAEGPDSAGGALPAGPILVPLATWIARRPELLARGTPVGVVLGPAEVPAVLAPDLARLAVVAVHFPKFADGRGYSIAYQLRRRLGYRGELRAVGDVQRDQLFYLSRSGFDAFLLGEGRDAQAALAALDDFAFTYQSAADGRAPRFRAGVPLTRAARG
jgi:uncharacterized protein (DUF934 family)